MKVNICLIAALGGPLFAGPTPSPLLYPRTDIDTVDRPLRFSLGDFNNDGITDVLSTSDQSRHLTVSLGNPDGTFREAVWRYTHSDVEDCVVADFNHDGFLDAAAALRSSPNIAVSFGLGDGRFASNISYPIDGYANNIFATDMNADGNPDLVCTYSNRDKVSVFMGSESGEFENAIDTNATETNQRAAIIHANDDGILDLLIPVVNPEPLILIYQGAPEGVFEYASTIALDSYATAVAVADFNGDGFQDFAVSEWDDGVIAHFAGNGDGTFLPHDPLQSTDRVSCMDTGDINGDGRADLVIASDFGVEVFLYAGDNAFSSPLQYPLPEGGFSDIAVEDLNADGHADVAVSKYNSNSGSVLHGRGDGTLVSTSQFSTEGEPRSLVSADFNGDSIPDLAYINASWNSIGVALGTASGEFSPPLNFSTAHSPYDMKIADFNSDGLPDLAVTHDQTNGYKVSVYLGNGDGTFTIWSDFETGSHLTVCAAADFTADDIPDIAVISRGNNTVQVFRNNADGSFSLIQELESASPTAITVGDLDADGHPEIIVGSQYNNSLLVYAAGSDGMYAQAALFDLGGRTGFLTVENLDQEHLPTLMAGTDAGILLIHKNPDGTYSQSIATTQYGGDYIGVADIDHDGHTDLVLLSGSTYFSVLRGHGDGTFTDGVRYAIAPLATSMVVTDLNGDDTADVAVTARPYDKVVVSTALPQTGVCPADFNADGVLNFFDVSAFIVAYSAQDPGADLTGDGAFNFFDISAFLVAFNAGCP